MSADRRRLQSERLLDDLARDERMQPAVRAAMQLGAKIGEARSSRGAFLLGLFLGFIVGLAVAVVLVRLGAAEGRQ